MKYALIGCGRIAVNHIKAALNNKLEIVAVCDVLPEKMETLLAKYELQDDKTHQKIYRLQGDDNKRETGACQYSYRKRHTC